MGQAVREAPSHDAIFGRTQASLLTDRVRGDILSGKLAPGQKLKFKDLTLHYGCGIMPLREALSRLATTGFVEAIDQRGFRVAPISREEVIDLAKTRRLIEQEALRAAMEHADGAYRDRVKEAFESLKEIQLFGDQLTGLNPDWEAAHEAFHEAIMSTCPSPWQLRLVRMLRDQSARYHYLALRTSGGVVRDASQEHRDLATCVITGKTKLACSILAKHITLTAELVLDQLFDAEPAPR